MKFIGTKAIQVPIDNVATVEFYGPDRAAIRSRAGANVSIHGAECVEQLRASIEKANEEPDNRFRGVTAEWRKATGAESCKLPPGFDKAAKAFEAAINGPAGPPLDIFPKAEGPLKQPSGGFCGPGIADLIAGLEGKLIRLTKSVTEPKLLSWPEQRTADGVLIMPDMRAFVIRGHMIETGTVVAIDREEVDGLGRILKIDQSCLGFKFGVSSFFPNDVFARANGARAELNRRKRVAEHLKSFATGTCQPTLPKVLSADGKEILPGDTVFAVLGDKYRSAIESTVESLDPLGNVEIKVAHPDHDRTFVVGPGRIYVDAAKALDSVIKHHDAVS